MKIEIKERQERAGEILDAIMSFARLDFSASLSVEEDGDVIDAIASGVNMLGEELNSSVVSLKEKEALLKEIHHRVKNNMQIISSMLRIQFEGETDPRLQVIARSSQDRIQAMSLIHEMLYATSHFKYTNVKAYVKRLSDYLHDSYHDDRFMVEVEIAIPENIQLEIDRIIPLGLLLNEVISNSYIHGLKDRDGRIYIHLQETSPDQFILKVGDDGIGLKSPFHFNEDANLGMQLIEMLTEQLDGKCDTKSKDGLHYTLTF